MDKQLLNDEFNAVRSESGTVIIQRCQRFIEDVAYNKNHSSDVVRGAVLLLRHIKEVEKDFYKEKDKTKQRDTDK